MEVKPYRKIKTEVSLFWTTLYVIHSFSHCQLDVFCHHFNKVLTYVGLCYCFCMCVYRARERLVRVESYVWWNNASVCRRSSDTACSTVSRQADKKQYEQRQ